MTNLVAITLNEVLQLGHSFFTRLEDAVVGAITANLDARRAGTWGGTDDEIFAPFAGYVEVWRIGAASRVLPLWEDRIAPSVAAAETALGHPLHKGAPLFNAGLAQFMTGDLDTAAKYIDAAGDENERLAPGTGRQLITGSGFSRQLLTDPIHAWISSTIGADYLTATAAPLDEPQFESLLAFLANRTSDAIAWLFALWRFSKQDTGPQTYAAGLQRTRAYAECLLVLESSLRRWQGGGLGQLCARCVSLVSSNTQATKMWHTLAGHYANFDWEQPTNLDAMIDHELDRFDASGTSVERCVIALWVSYRMRNSLLHVLDDRLGVFGNVTKLRRLLALATVAIRLSQRGADGTIAAL